ncbi:MAG: STM2901 family protein [Pseudomonadota bacterium]
MDTVEQMNGKYFFDGMSVDKNELLYWLILDEFKKQFSGITDILAVASMLMSFPMITVEGKLGGGLTKGTSPLSLVSRSLIRQRFRTRRRTITWEHMLRGRWAYTASLGAYIGRWVPWLGAVLTMWDISVITKNVVHRYRLIVGNEGSEL